MITTSLTLSSWITLNPMKTIKKIGKYLAIIFMISGVMFLIIRENNPTQMIDYQKRLQPTIGVYYEVVTASGYKEPSVFMIVKELQFEKVYDDLVVISKRTREIELPFKNQIGKSGKYLTLITIDGVLTVKNFSDLKELRAYKKL